MADLDLIRLRKRLDIAGWDYRDDAVSVLDALDAANVRIQYLIANVGTVAAILEERAKLQDGKRGVLGKADSAELRELVEILRGACDWDEENNRKALRQAEYFGNLRNEAELALDLLKRPKNRLSHVEAAVGALTRGLTEP